MKKFLFFLLVSYLFFSEDTLAQQQPPVEYGDGLKVNLSEDKSKYFRLITWHQIWIDLQKKPAPDGDEKLTATPMLRRSRILLYAQLSDRFLILTHFGLNNLTPDCLDPTGFSSQTQLFMHDAWVEFKIFKPLYLGGGLHYWNGISRLNSQSTLNFLPLDNPRYAWATLGTTDQFGRHLGIYAKGKLGRLDYRLAWNGPIVHSMDVNENIQPTTTRAAYIGRDKLGIEAANIFSGYFNFQFWEQENNKLPYFVGSYLGKKKVFNIGAGFYTHPRGSVLLSPADTAKLVGQNVLLWAVDHFMDLPFGRNAGLTTYLSYQLNDYGPNYRLAGSSQCVFTGNVLYFQGGLLLPSRREVAWQPYLTMTRKHIEAFDGTAWNYGFGLNCLITGHHAKLTLEYRSTGMVDSEALNQLILQAAVFL